MPTAPPARGTLEVRVREQFLRRTGQAIPPLSLVGQGLAFVAVGALWILATDTLLGRLVHDPVTLTRLQTLKGWLFVVASGLYLVALARRSYQRLAAAKLLLEAVFNSVADGLLLLDAEGTIVEVNRAAARMLRAEPGELIGMGAPGFSRRFRLTDEAGRRVPPEQYISQRARSGIAPPRYIAVLQVGPPGPLYIESSAAPVRLPGSGQVVAVVSVMRDVTEQRQFLHLRDDFLSTVAHELRTPLTVMKLSLAREAQPSPGLERAVARMEWLVEELLEALQVRTGELPMRQEAVELTPLARELVDAYRAQHPGHSITFRADGEHQLQTDRSHLQEILRHLLDNAVRYSPGGGLIEVEVRAGAEQVELSVTDHGLGIPSERQEHVFERYFRGHAGTPVDYGRLGLGLYLSKALAVALGGDLSFQSEAGRGSRFALTLPLPQLPRDERPPPAPPLQPSAP